MQILVIILLLLAFTHKPTNNANRDYWPPKVGDTMIKKYYEFNEQTRLVEVVKKENYTYNGEDWEKDEDL